MYLRMLIICLLQFSLSSQAAKQPKRLAMVIGNALYQHSKPLLNPVKDADSMEVALKQCGFEVLKYCNADRNVMEQASIDLSSKIQNNQAENPIETVLFYYSGHGMELSGENYLIPVDAVVNSMEEAKLRCSPVSRFSSILQENEIKYSIILLDACRENPFPKQMKNWGSKGLAVTNIPASLKSFVGYAAAPGALAWDGEILGNGVYTKAILQHLRTPDRTISEIFTKVAKSTEEMARAKGHNQTPFNLTNITEDFYFIRTQNQLRELSDGKDSAFIGKMILVAGGSFVMGCKEGRDYPCKLDVRPSHEVILDSFFIGQTEVTVGQWKAVMGNLKGVQVDESCLECPMENISFDQIQGFIASLNKKSQFRYRLPTEAEWEFAARGGRKSKNYRFAGSNNHHEVVSNIFRSEPEGDFRGSGEMKKVMPVKQSIPNELGIYDMSGNVWEFCQDWYQADYYQKSEKKNPRGPLEDTQYHTIRGSFWDFEKPEDNCGVANRSNIHHSMRAQKLGFRLVRSVHQN